MLYIFMGQACTGKAPIIEEIKSRTDYSVYMENDYLEFSNEEEEAFNLFYKELIRAGNNERDLIYVIEDLNSLERIKDIDNSINVKFNSPLNTIKERFKDSLEDGLTIPIISMIERDFHLWEHINGDINVDTTETSIDEILKLIDIY